VHWHDAGGILLKIDPDFEAALRDLADQV